MEQGEFWISFGVHINLLEMHKRRQEPQCEDYAAAVRALVFELN